MDPDIPLEQPDSVVAPEPSQQNRKTLKLVYIVLIIAVAITLVFVFIHPSKNAVGSQKGALIQPIATTPSKTSATNSSPIGNVSVKVTGVSFYLNYSNHSYTENSVSGLSINFSRFPNEVWTYSRPPFILEGRSKFNITVYFSFFPPVGFSDLVMVLNISTVPSTFKIVGYNPKLGLYVKPDSVTNITLSLVSPNQSYSGNLGFLVSAANT